MSENQHYIVLKFGGTSQKYSTYEMILNRIHEITKQKIKIIIVLSAISEITNKLLEYVNTLCSETLTEIINKNVILASECNVNINELITKFIFEENNFANINNKISFVSKGEFFTCHILNRYLNNNNIKSKFVSSHDIIYSSLENDSFYNKGELSVESNIIINELKNNDVIIIPGFSGRTPENNCCLLGRGGSDTSGSIIAAAINAQCYEIWTDVNGIYSSDPKKILNTHINHIINYDAAQEIAAMGAKVLHPYCILPCALKSIPIYIKNTFEPNSKSTIITKIESNHIYGVIIQDNVKVFKIKSLNIWNNYSFVYDIFSIFEKFNVDINIINSSRFNIMITTDDHDNYKLLNIKSKLEEKYLVDIKTNNSIISVVGDNIRMIQNISDIFKLTKKFNIITTSYSSNDMTLSFVVDSSIAINLAQQLHDIVFSLDYK